MVPPALFKRQAGVAGELYWGMLEQFHNARVENNVPRLDMDVHAFLPLKDPKSL